MSQSKDCTVPPACFTCGAVIGHLYGEYLRLIDEKNKDIDINQETFDKINNRDIIEKLGLQHRYCCFQHLMTHPRKLNNNL